MSGRPHISEIARRVVEIPLPFPDPDGRHALFRVFLQGLVPLRIWELWDASEAEVKKLREEAVELISSHGDDIQFDGKYQTEGRVALVTALAVLARAEGGASILGVHACIEPHEGCPADK